MCNWRIRRNEASRFLSSRQPLSLSVWMSQMNCQREDSAEMIASIVRAGRRKRMREDNDVLYVWRHRLTAMPPLLRIFSVTKRLTIGFSRLICERHKYSLLDPVVSGTDYVRQDHT